MNASSPKSSPVPGERLEEREVAVFAGEVTVERDCGRDGETVRGLSRADERTAPAERAPPRGVRASLAAGAGIAVLALAVTSAAPAGDVGTGAPLARALGAEARLPALRGRTILVDPGHNGGNAAHSAEIGRLVDAGTLKKPCDTVGTQTRSGLTEAAYALDLGLRLARLLRARGAHVVLTREDNRGWGPCITERAAIGNRARADAAISIHADGGPASGRGFHVIYPRRLAGLTDDIASSSQRLARSVRTAYRAGTHMPYATYVGQRGLAERSDLGGLNRSHVPKVFIETANMRNPVDAALLARPGFRGRQARALARGLERFLSGR